MLNRIIGFSIRNKLLIGLCTLALIGMGVYEATRLPIDAVPDITDNQVQIITMAPSFGATDIERLVTFPVEQAVSNIGGIKSVRSFSRFGLSLVTIVFTDATDIYWARQQVAERLQNVKDQIPQGIGTPVLGPISTGLGEIYQYVVRPEKGYEGQYDATALRTIQDWIVRRQLLGVKGVAEVSSFGGKLKQYEIAVKPGTLQSLNVTMDDIFTALEKNNQNSGGAYIEKGETVLFIRSEGLIGNTEDIENIAVKATPGGTPLFIKDVAEVKIGYATRFGAMCYNDQGEVAGAIVMMLKGTNSSAVIKDVKERIALIQKILPEGVVIEPFLDRTKMVNNAISTVEKNLIEGALIVVFILVLFLGNFRAGILVASVIPLAMLFAIIMMNAFGVSGNLMSLGALDFGLIVDGAVIIVEAVMHQLSHSKAFASVQRIAQADMDKEVGQSAGRMMNSAVFGQLIILIVYLPIFTLQGIEGKMFAPMAQTVAFALIGAFILSLTYIPMMSSLILSKEIKHQPNVSDNMMFKLEKKYEQALSGILQYPKLTLGFVGALFIAALIVLLKLGGEFIPSLEEGDFAVDTRVLTGSNLNTTIAYTQRGAHILKSEFPEVEKVVTKIGSGEVPTDPMPIEAADMMVILKDKSEWTSAKTFPEMAEKMSKALEQIPGITTGFQYPVQMRFNELMTGARQDVVCKIFGEDLDTLSYYADRLGALVNTIDGAQDLYKEPVTGIPQVVITYHRAVIAQYNLTITDINRVIHAAFAGQSAGMIFEGERRFELVVRLAQRQRSSVSDIQNLLIPTPHGSRIPLYQLADVSIQNGPNQIQREDNKRRIVVGFNVRGRDVQSIVEELQDKVDGQIKLPAGYYVGFGGAFENLNEAKQRLMIAVPVSLLLIFILLFFAFGSIKQGLLIYTAIPLSAIGGIFSLALRDMPFSISAGVGFIALFGVAVLNGIVLIAEFNRIRKTGVEDLDQIVLMGTKVRLRPVIMTALVASLGFLPMALSHGAGAEVQRPLATVVIGGLMLATFLTLFVLPILYILFDKVHMPVISKRGLVVVLFFLSAIFSIQAQTITWKAAMDSAVKNNYSIKNQHLVAEYNRQLQRSGANLPQANVSGEMGQVNSIFFDTRFGISQSFSFPTVYANQRRATTQEWNAAVIAVSLTTAEIQKTASGLFYHIMLLREREKLLSHADSLFAEFINKANLRFRLGETNNLERISAESYRGNILVQQKALQTEIELSQLQFQLILNTARYYEPVSSSLKMEAPAVVDSLSLDLHPALNLSRQQVKIANANLLMEKSRLLPDLTVGYFNQSIRGIGADDKFYNSSKRFDGFQVGLGIPVFSGYQRSRIAAAKVQIDILENKLNEQRKQLQNELMAAISQYKSSAEVVGYFESSQLPNVEIISQTIALQFASGEKNYLEWVMLSNQALLIRGNYLSAIEKLNESINQINYLTTK